MEKYDIIVVGAGPAGLSFAEHIEDKSVLVIDRKKELGVPIKSSAATFADTLIDFELKDAVCHSSRGFRVILDNGYIKEFLYEKPVLYTLDFTKMIRILKKRMQKNCDILHPASVERISMDNGSIKSIETNENNFKADLFIDASGESRVLLKHLNSSYYRKQWLIHGLEYEVSKIDLNSTYFDFFFGNNLIPEGYCWVFPTGNTSARIGLGKLIPGRGGLRKIKLKDALQKFISSNVITAENFDNNNILEYHGGIMTYNKPLKNAYFKNCFVIGDAASQSSCLLGEGIRHSLRSGRELAIALNSFDLDFAKIYFQRYIDNNTKFFEYFPLFLQYFKIAPNWAILTLVKALSDYDNTNMLRLLRSEFKSSDFMKLLYTFPRNMI